MRQFACVVFLMIISAALQAAEPFYQISTPVASQAPEARAVSASKALKDMLWRLTGGKQAEQNTAMASVFSRAETYAESFSYTGTGEVTFTFSAAALSQLIKDYGLPYWPANRPKVLVWSASNGQWNAAEDKTAGVAASLAELKIQAQLRGITLVFPHYDSDDRTALSLEQFKAFDHEALLNASFRYNLDTIMAVQWSDSGSRWQFDHRGDMRSGDNAVQGIDQLADFLASRYAVGSGTNTQTSAFLGITATNLGEFKQIGDYLKKHSLITSSRLVQSNGHELVFEVNLRASLSQFNSSLSLDRRLEVGANPEGASTLNTPLNYRWIAN